MTERQAARLAELAETYAKVVGDINSFITENDLDYDEVWDKANQAYDRQCSEASDGCREKKG